MPEEGYFEEEFDKLKEALSQRISYQSYVDIFEQTQDVLADEQISISMNNLQVAGLNITIPNFIDFEFIETCKQFYFPWIRGMAFLLLAVGCINNVYKLIRGKSLFDIAFIPGSHTVDNSKNGDGKK